jgi:hypothetical protein
MMRTEAKDETSRAQTNAEASRMLLLAGGK